MNSMRTLALTPILVLLLSGCPRETVDRCSGPDLHPECPGAMTDLGVPDADADAAADMTAQPDFGPDVALPCGGSCADPTPLCDAVSNMCVECSVTTDCSSGVCESQRCVECVADADCTDGVCGPDNSCVECVANTDCTSTAASTCDTTTNTCVACTASTDCGHLTGTTVCDTGECVECTGTEFGTCTGVCDSRLRTCTDFPAADLGLCEACVSDAQCRPGMLCVPMTFDAADGSGPAEVGTFCLWRLDATETNAPNGACSTVRPYIDATDYTSLDGIATMMCGLNVTTCEGINAYQITCPTAGANDACGAPGFDDAFCVMFDAATNFCTVPCAGNNDCKPGFACDTTVTPNRCEL